MKEATGFNVNLQQVAPWLQTPIELVTVSAVNLRVDITHDPDSTPKVIAPVKDFVNRLLLPKKHPDFYDGLYTNVDAISVNGICVSIKTGLTNAFDYVAAAWYYRGTPHLNPVRPLTVSVCIADLHRRVILLEKRPDTVIDHPGKISVLGGALLPGEDPKVGARRCLNNKWGINLSSRDLCPIAIGHETSDRAYNIVYEARLPMDALSHIIRINAERRELWSEPALNYSTMRGEMLQWSPLGFLAFICEAHHCAGLSGGPREREFLSQACGTFDKKPYYHAFPMERYLPAELRA